MTPSDKVLSVEEIFGFRKSMDDFGYPVNHRERRLADSHEQLRWQLRYANRLISDVRYEMHAAMTCLPSHPPAEGEMDDWYCAQRGVSDAIAAAIKDIDTFLARTESTLARPDARSGGAAAGRPASVATSNVGDSDTAGSQGGPLAGAAASVECTGPYSDGKTCPAHGTGSAQRTR